MSKICVGTKGNDFCFKWVLNVLTGKPKILDSTGTVSYLWPKAIFLKLVENEAYDATCSMGDNCVCIRTFSIDTVVMKVDHSQYNLNGPGKFGWMYIF